MPDKPSQRFVALDGWRGICALLVALYHFPMGGHVQVLPMFRDSYLFVDFFFVLSGFVITFAGEDRLDAGGSRVDFLWRRVARIWPLHAFVLGVMVANEAIHWAWLEGGFNILRMSQIPANLLLMHGWGWAKGLSWNWPSWSLSVEMALYGLFAVGFMAVPRKARVGLAILIVVAALTIVGLNSSRYMGATYDYGLARGAAGFFAGYLVRRLWLVVPSRLGLWGEVAVIALVVAFVSTARIGPWTLMAPAVFGLAVWVFASESGVISRVLKTSPMIKVGAWSYSIYMVHGPLIFAIKWCYAQAYPGAGSITKLAKALHAPFLGDAMALAFTALVLAVASVTYRHVEMPAQKAMLAWGKGRFGRHGEQRLEEQLS